MSIISDIFSTKGSVPRLRYFIANISVAVVVGIIVAFLLMVAIGSAMGAASANPGSNGIYMIVSLAILFVTGIFYLFATINLMMKRLRDIGHSPLHAVWVIALNALGQMIIVLPIGRYFSGLMVLVAFLAQLYILFAKGKDEVPIKDIFA